MVILERLRMFSFLKRKGDEIDIRSFAFELDTIQWMSSMERDSEYTFGWNNALDAVKRELLLRLEQKKIVND